MGRLGPAPTSHLGRMHLVAIRGAGLAVRGRRPPPGCGARPRACSPSAIQCGPEGDSRTPHVASFLPAVAECSLRGAPRERSRWLGTPQAPTRLLARAPPPARVCTCLALNRWPTPPGTPWPVLPPAAADGRLGVVWRVAIDRPPGRPPALGGESGSAVREEWERHLLSERRRETAGAATFRRARPPLSPP